jgi:hypothetical protein
MAVFSPDGSELRSFGFEVYFPPTPFKPRFVLHEATKDTFYDVDTTYQPLPSQPAWNSIAAHEISDPAIMLSGNVRGSSESVTGFLIAIDCRERETFIGRHIARVQVRELNPALMSWEGLKDMKGPVLPAEMKAGLMERLWNRRSGVTAPDASGPFVSDMAVLSNMPRRWHVDGAALNYELDYIFAAGRELSPDQKWKIY